MPYQRGNGGAAGSSADARAEVLIRRRGAWRRRGAAVAAALLVVGGLALSRGDHAVGAAIVAGAAAVWVLVGLAVTRSVGRDPLRWSRGAAGERRTAEVLEQLPPRRWSVRHDLALPGSRANIDHLAIGPTGVWVIDTKTTSSPVRARFRTVRFGERRLDTQSLRFEATVVDDRLRQAGWDVPVRPLVVVHGEGLRRRGGRSGGVEVVPAAALVRRLRRGRRVLRRGRRAAVALVLDEVFVPAWGTGRVLERQGRDGTRRG